ncbi:MAG TPA: hypothetical protein VD833_13475 [Vicinamibacterales bacterium]|nr:hypothetical protein [Vicinamibacterales bacterium]
MTSMHWLGGAAILAGVLQAAPLPQWTAQSSGVTARLRGVSAVDDHVVWASGASGTVLRTADGGRSWESLAVPGASSRDFRDIDAVDARTAYVLSIGPGDQSRIYKTSDAGGTWIEQFVNHEEQGFFDAMGFWDALSGVAFSDSIDGRFLVVRTIDGGRQWLRVPVENLPPALPGEGAFAASGTNVAVHGRDRVWIATGAASLSRVLRSVDRGRTWGVSPTPLASGASSGIFSIAFRDAQHGIVVGGDYLKPDDTGENAAVTRDGGMTWEPVRGLSGFRSAVAYVPGRPSLVLAVGPSGTDLSMDDGRTWRGLAGPGFHALSVSPSGAHAWGVGEDGRIGLLRLD